MLRTLAILVAAQSGVVLGLFQGATYYVAPDGNDEQAGSAKAPFRTLARAEREVGPGDTVIVRDGVYHLGPGGFVTRKSGTADAPITWKAEHVGKATLINWQRVDGWEKHEGSIYKVAMEKRPLCLLEDEDHLFHATADRVRYLDEKWAPGRWDWEDDALRVWLWEGDSPERHVMRASHGNIVNLTGDASYQVWDGFVIEYGLCGWKTHYAECRHNVVRNCTFRYLGQGILGAEDAIVEHNYFYNIGSSKWHHGIYDGKRNTIIRYNIFEKISGGALHLYPRPANISAYGNVIRGPKVERTLGKGQVGIYAWGEGGHRIYRNVIYGGHAVGISNNASGNLIANNTILDVTGTGIYLHGDRTGNRMLNNVISGRSCLVQITTAPNELDHNLYAGGESWVWDGESLTAFADWRRASGQDAHSLFGADPLLADPANEDFVPLRGSPLIDAGCLVPGVTNGVGGKAPDVGAYEVGRVAAPAPGPQRRAR